VESKTFLQRDAQQIEREIAPTLSSSFDRTSDFPRRIVCLTDETAETLYLLGEQERIVGVSGFSTRPAEVRLKPRVSAFSSANFEAILALKPDLVLTFSDVQAEIARELILRGAAVMNFNQRSVSGILDMIAALARLVGKQSEGEALVAGFVRGLDEIAESAKTFARRPRVFFEEWNEPLIGGIEWAEELIEIAGGEPIFPELRGCGKAKDRVVEAADVAARDPDVILASWCGKKVDRQAILARPGWAQMSAVRSGHVYEIQSSVILQPGPAALTDGVRRIHAILARVANNAVAPDSGSRERIVV
jgi:iron complex transport system substrate-binding protein